MSTPTALRKIAESISKVRGGIASLSSSSWYSKYLDSLVSGWWTSAETCVNITIYFGKILPNSGVFL